MKNRSLKVLLGVMFLVSSVSVIGANEEQSQSSLVKRALKKVVAVVKSPKFLVPVAITGAGVAMVIYWHKSRGIAQPNKSTRPQAPVTYIDPQKLGVAGYEINEDPQHVQDLAKIRLGLESSITNGVNLGDFVEAATAYECRSLASDARIVKASQEVIDFWSQKAELKKKSN